MAWEDTVKIGEAMTKKWNEEHPGEKMPDIDSEEFNQFVNECLQEGFESNMNKTVDNGDANSPSEASDNSASTIFVDHTYEYKKVTFKDMRDAVKNWFDSHPNVGLGIMVTLGSIVSYKLCQSFVSGAIYKGNLKSYRYIRKHYENE